MDICGRDGHLVVDPVLGLVRFIHHRCVGFSHGMQILTVINFPMVDEEKKCMLLVMRVLSIVPLNFKVRVHNNFFCFFFCFVCFGLERGGGGCRFGDSRTKIELPPTEIELMDNIFIFILIFTADAVVCPVVPGVAGV